MNTVVSRLTLLLFGLFVFGGAAWGDEAPAPSARVVHVVLFRPADVDVPKGARERLTGIADYTEKFFSTEMTKCGYPPQVRALFRRDKDGRVEVFEVRGDSPVSSGKYDKPGYARDVIAQARQQYHIAETNGVWWIFVFLGDRPARFADFRGIGNARDGGSAMVNYDSLPGKIQPDLGPAEGFNGEIFLKGMMHELGHAFGLMHLGPDTNLGLGNTLMGPQTVVYKRRAHSKSEKIYLGDTSAALLWKHPIFAGATNERFTLPNVKLEDYQAAYNRASDTITLSGKLVSDQNAHSVVLIDDMGKPRDQYWRGNHAARIDSGGKFHITITKPPHVSGHYQILFCFDNGLVTGDGEHVTFDNHGAIRKSYEFQDGNFVFGD